MLRIIRAKRLLLVGAVAGSTKGLAGGEGGMARRFPPTYLPTCLIAGEKGCKKAAVGRMTQGSFEVLSIGSTPHLEQSGWTRPHGTLCAAPQRQCRHQHICHHGSATQHPPQHQGMHPHQLGRQQESPLWGHNGPHLSKALPSLVVLCTSG